ncbi:hypothetical protein T439DRAFT_17481 [Meredithblackwellia eburnea MCA 4105]
MDGSLSIPGYYFDNTKNKYFKLLPGQSPPTVNNGDAHRNKRPKLDRDRDEHKDKHRRTGVAGVGWDTIRSRSTIINSFTDHHELTSLRLSQSILKTSYEPTCLPIDDSISAFAFDRAYPDVLRVAGESGTLATGQYEDDSFMDTWRTSWMFPSRVTSLQCCGGRILATSLGPPAQALVGTTEDAVSLASVTLSPRKTSLWTSALSPSLVALGCDRKVLISRDPSSATMDGYTTGGKGGGGTVFGLDLDETLIYAGTRKGNLKVFDTRSSPTAAPSNGAAAGSGEEPVSRAEINLAFPTSVTNVRRLKSSTAASVVVAQIDG